MVLLLQLSIKQELKLSETPAQIKKDKKGAKDMMVCPKKKKRKQRSPAKVQVNVISEITVFLNGLSCICLTVFHGDNCKNESNTNISLFPLLL